MASPGPRHLPAMAPMDLRTKEYPPVPPRGGPGAPKLSIVLPTRGDLRLRPLLPNLFLQQFAIHCNAEHRQVYAKFLVVRKFIVMSKDGDLYTQTYSVTLRLAELPNAALLPLPPPLSTWDIVKVLDLVQCYTFGGVQGASLLPNVRWELVRVRWRNNRETWIPIELMASQSPALLQDFYVNSINSWSFRDRIFAQSLTVYRTEIELWLHQPEFQKFYEQLRRRRALLTTGAAPPQSNRNAAAATNSASVNGNSVDVKDRRLTAEAARDNYQPPAPQSRPPAPHSQPTAPFSRPPAQWTLPRQSQPAPPSMAYQPSQSQSAPLNMAYPRPLAPLAPPAEAIRPRIPQPYPAAPVPPPLPRGPPPPLQHPAVTSVSRHEPLPPTPPRPSHQPRQNLRHPPPPLPALSLNISAPVQPTSQPLHQQHQQQQQTDAAPKQPRQERERAASSPSKETKEKKQKKKKKKKKTDNESEDDEVLLPSKKTRSKREKRKEREKEPQESPASQKRRRKRLKWSQAAANDSDDDNVDDLLELTQPSEKEKEDKKERKRLRRLRKASDKKKKEVSIIVIDDSDEDEDEVLAKDQPKKQVSEEKATSKKKMKKKEKKKKQEEDASSSAAENELKEGKLPMEIDAAAFEEGEVESEGDDVDEEEGASQAMLHGEIRCECGVSTVGRYTGQWLQCCYESCGAWQHAECVGLLVRRSDDAGGERNPRLPEEYRCSKCDVLSFQDRYEKAQTYHLRAWLSLCCESKNEKQLLKLLEDEEKRDPLAAVELAASSSKRSGSPSLLVEAARQGLTRTVRRLVRRYKVNVFAADANSQNVLHHVAVAGESVQTARFLLTTAPGLVRHQDLSGEMPLHGLLRSAKLNALCLPLLQQDQPLCVTSNFAGCMPIHFACQTVNEHTVEIVREILEVQPLIGLERSPEGLTPLLLLCRAAGSSDIVKQAACVQEIVEMLLDIDMLGGFLRARDIRGWTAVHFAAASGNHILLQWLCEVEGVEGDATTFESGETALHIAARGNHAQCVRVLLENRRCSLDSTLVDGGSKWIALLHATEASCVQQLLYHDLGGQLQQLSRLAQLQQLSPLKGSFHHNEALRRWLQRLVSEPICFAIVNDWLQFHTHILGDLYELVVLHRSLLRVDNKLDLLYLVVFHLIKSQSRPVVPVRVIEADKPETDALPTTLEISLSSSGECYWKQFVAQTRDLDARAFRQKLRIVIPRGGNLVLDNLTLVLVRLLSGLLQPSTGLLVRDPLDATLLPSPLRAGDDAATLQEFYVLGELIAYLVICDVPLGELFEFSTPFLQRVLKLRGQNDQLRDSAASIVAFNAHADSFAAGFDAVLPATLRLLQVEDFRLVLNARTHSLGVFSLDWGAAVDWIRFDVAAEDDATVTGGEGETPVPSTVAWWTRLTTELVEDELASLVLWLCGSFRFARQLLFATEDTEAGSVAPRLKIERFKLATADPSSGSDGEGEDSSQHQHSSLSVDADEDDVLPQLVVTADQRTLVLPQYSSYERFRVAVLRVFRRADSVPTRR